MKPTKLIAVVAPILLGACAPGDNVSEKGNGLQESLLEDSLLVDESGISGRAVSVVHGACLGGNPARGEPWHISALPDSLTKIDFVRSADFPMRDSALVTAQISRAIEAIPADSASGEFLGLPIIVRDFWIGEAYPEDSLVIAMAVRRMPMESSPIEEHTLAILGPVSGTGPSDKRPLYWSVRSSGLEDVVHSRDPIGVYRTESGRTLLLWVSETSEEVRVDGVFRDEENQWGPIQSVLALPCR